MVDNLLLLLDHVGLLHVLDLAVHLVIVFGWMGKGNHSKTFLLLALCSKTTPSLLKVRGGGWVVAAPGDYSVTLVPIGLDF